MATPLSLTTVSKALTLQPPVPQGKRFSAALTVMALIRMEVFCPSPTCHRPGNSAGGNMLIYLNPANYKPDMHGGAGQILKADNWLEPAKMYQTSTERYWTYE